MKEIQRFSVMSGSVESGGLCGVRLLGLGRDGKAASRSLYVVNPAIDNGGWRRSRD